MEAVEYNNHNRTRVYTLFDGFEVVAGSAREFVDCLKDSSWFTFGKTNAEYMRGFARRLGLYQSIDNHATADIDTSSPDSFVNSLVEFNLLQIAELN